MSVFRGTESHAIAPLFSGRKASLVRSYLDGCMGEACADHPKAPRSAVVIVAGFCYFAGEASEELVRHAYQLIPQYAIMVHPTDEWGRAIERILQGKAHPWIRYATDPAKTSFDQERLQDFLSRLPESYELRPIDREIYDRILTLPWVWDLCGNLPGGYSRFAEHGLGYVILHNGEIVSGASTYAYFHGGIEVEIDTRPDYQRRGLATICGAALILECLRRGLYPNWDAHNKESLVLAEKLGYVLERAYPVYLVAS